MDVTDEDMQMVRTWLEEAKAPEYIKGHFENLVEMQAADAERVEDLESEVRDLQDEESARYQKLEEQYDELKNEQQAEADAHALGALETVKYWLHDVLFLQRPMQKPPREILRIVEEAL